MSKRSHGYYIKSVRRLW